MYKLYVQVHSAYPVLRYALRAYLNYDTLRVGWQGKGGKRKNFFTSWVADIYIN